MTCQSCGQPLEADEACFRCEVTPAAHRLCSDAEVHTCERCTDQSACQELYLTAADQSKSQPAEAH